MKTIGNAKVARTAIMKSLWLAASLSATAVATTATHVRADDFNDPIASERGNWSVGITAGTLGAGIEAALRLHPNIVVRGDVTYGDLGFAIDSATLSAGMVAGDQSLTALTLMTAGVTLDWHPFRDGARISAGARFFDAEIEGTAENGDPITFKATSSTSILPYVGFGYDSAFFKDYGLSLSTDFGALIGPEFDVDVSSTTLNASQRATAANELASELNGIGLYPVIQISGKYRF